MKNTSIIVFFIFFSHPAFLQDTVHVKQGKTNIMSIGAGIQYGFVFAHSPAVANTKGSNPFGMEFILSWQRNDKYVWDLCNCYPRKGLLLSYYNYDNSILGHGMLAAWFLEPAFRIGKRSFFSIKGAAGLGYLTNPHHPENNSYSSAISGYLVLGTGIWIALSDQWWINPSLNYQHISNGGLRQPNKGINWPTAGLGVSYVPRPMPHFTGTRKTERYWKGQPPRWDIGLFGMALRGTDNAGNTKRVPMAGFQFQLSKQVGRVHAATVGIEFSTDHSLYQKLRTDSIDASAIRGGFLVGHEFLLGKFNFNQRLGLYIFDQTPYNDFLYHTWGIHFRMSKHWGVGINLKAHRQVAEHVDLRLVYSFGEN